MSKVKPLTDKFLVRHFNNIYRHYFHCWSRLYIVSIKFGPLPKSLAGQCSFEPTRIIISNRIRRWEREAVLRILVHEIVHAARNSHDCVFKLGKKHKISQAFAQDVGRILAALYPEVL